MKLFSLIIPVICAAVSSFAQCDNFYYLQPNKTVEMAMTNNNGKSTGKIIYKTSDVSSSGKTVSSTLNQEAFDAKGKSVSASSTRIKCTGGNMMMDIKSFISSNPGNQRQTYEIKGADVYIEYPSGVSVGSALPDGKASFITKNGNVDGEMDLELTNRQVTAKESVTTPAGIWECFKITYSLKIASKIAGISIPIKMEATEWFAPGFGVVKSGTKYGETKIVSVQ